jgi:hypothetical protein
VDAEISVVQNNNRPNASPQRRPHEDWSLFMKFRIPCSLLISAALTISIFNVPQRTAAASAAVTTTTLAVTSASKKVTTVKAGAVVTLTATVKVGGTAVTTGLVNFCDATAKYCTDIHILGSAQLTAAGAAIFKFRPADGSHSYKAAFQGTTSNAASSSSDSKLTVSAGKDPSATTIAASSASSGYNLTAIVSGYSNADTAAAPAGKVSFIDTSNKNKVLGSASLGTATESAIDWFSTQTPALASSPENLQYAAVGDFNEDGIPDLAVTRNYISAEDCFDICSGVVTILLGNGDGTFTVSPKTLKVIAGVPWLITPTDLNQDGHTDLVVLSNGEDTDEGDVAVTFFLGNGDGTFTAEPERDVPYMGENPGAMVVDDFNGDGIPDLVTFGIDGIYIKLGNGDGTFLGAKVSSIPINHSTANSSKNSSSYSSDVLATGDFNGDGYPDLALSSTSGIEILLNSGKGKFALKSTVAITDTTYSSSVIAIGDFNGDGKADLAVAEFNRSSLLGRIEIFLGNGDGTFTAKTHYETAADPNDITLGDFTGSGKVDLAVAENTNNTDGQVQVFLGNGDGTFTEAAENPVADNTAYSLVSADFFGLGLPGLAVVNSGSNTVSILQPAYTRLATAALSDVTLSNGLHTIEAKYAGNSSYAASTSATTTIDKRKVPVITWPTPVAIGYGTQLSSKQLDAKASVAGTFVYNTTAETVLPVGSQTLDAAFTPTNTTAYAPVSKSVMLTVNKGTPGVDLLSPVKSVPAGQMITFLVWVYGGDSILITQPTGTVTIYDGTKSLETFDVYSGGNLVSFNTSAVPWTVGKHTITASYSGDSNYLAKTSAPVTVTVTAQ